MENVTVTNTHSSVVNNGEDVKIIATSYLMYKIGRFSFLLFMSTESLIKLPDEIGPTFCTFVLRYGIGWQEFNLDFHKHTRFVIMTILESR